MGFCLCLTSTKMLGKNNCEKTLVEDNIVDLI